MVGVVGGSWYTIPEINAMMLEMIKTQKGNK